MKIFPQAASALEPYSPLSALAPVCPTPTRLHSTCFAPSCRNCGEFLPSQRTPSVGICLLHDVRVLAQDKACSQYYQSQTAHQSQTGEPVGNDDEF